MRLIGKTCSAILSLALALGLVCAMSGCDAGVQKTETKPIESNILKKLASANQAQSAEAKAKAATRVKKRN